MVYLSIDMRQKLLAKKLEQYHKDSADIIDYISTIGIEQMKLAGEPLNVNDIQPERIAYYAAKTLGMDVDDLTRVYYAALYCEELAGFV